MTSEPHTIRFVNPPSLPRPMGYSHIAEVLSGRTVYLSGQVALDQAAGINLLANAGV